MQPTDTMEVRRGSDRGSFVNSWLNARFSFSFGSYQAPGRDGFGSLRALNEDVIQPGTGFDMHPHRDLDIFILPLAGVVEHRDSLGNHAWVRPGQVQRMRAGRGIQHSQKNASTTDLDHHLQIWLQPRRLGATPTVEMRDFGLFGRPGDWCSVISPEGLEGSFTNDNGTTMATTRVGSGTQAVWRPRKDSMLYLHAIDGVAAVRLGQAGEFDLGQGDALAVTSASGRPLQIEGQDASSRLLIFEFLPSD